MTATIHLDPSTRSETASRALAEWIVEFEYADAPATVQLAARQAFMNTLGTAIGGSRLESSQRAIRYAKEQGRTGKCMVLVDGAQLCTSMAVFANGVMANALGQEETHVASSTHPSQTTVPTVLALAESLDKSGKEVLEALIAGMEVTASVSQMQLTPEIKLDKCHAPAVFGTIGAAAAAAKLVGLDRDGTAHALGLAANFAAGLSECSRAGTGEYHYLKGLVGQHALLAAELAADGAVAAPLAFEGPGGFYHTFAGVPREELNSFDVAHDLRSLLRENWITADLMYKRYPANFFNIPFIDAAREIRRDRGLQAGDIRTVRLQISEYASHSGGLLRPPFTNRGNALASTTFGVSCMLARGHVLPDDTVDIDAPDILQMCERVEVTVAPNDVHGGLMEIVTSEGTVSIDLAQRLGNYRLSDTEVREISETASAAVFSSTQIDELLTELDELESAPSVRRIMELAASPARDLVTNREGKAPR